ncbi:MAG: hypothetical protein K8F27_15335, partial [Sulfuricellaceae bacterium]|nr:hypothetical protein [Sulfuricellaceae bacterium]
MKTQTYRNFRLALALALLAFPLAALAANPADNSAGPLVWQATRVPPAFPAQEAVVQASRYLGLSGTIKPVLPPQFVQVSDFTPDGNVRKTVYYAWLLTLPGVPATNANSKAAAEIAVSVLVDANDKGLDAAFTAKNDMKWVPRYPSFKERDPFQVMADDGWSVGKPLSTQLNSTVSQVLSALW